MEKKLPNVFVNKVDKEFQNNETVFYSKEEKVDTDRQDIRGSSNMIGKNINQKINAVFNSPRYVYKADVNITTRNGVLHKRIVGRNMNHLITIDNELIPISEITDIEFSN